MIEDIKNSLGIHKDFPKQGIEFVDISPVMKNKEQFKHLIDHISGLYKDKEIDKVISIEARGFILGSALAHKLNSGFVMVRKKGKLPGETIQSSYSKEYGTDGIEIQKDSIEPNDRVLVVDDLLATGGTMIACIDMLKQLNANIVDIFCLIELEYLDGRKRVKEHFDSITSIIKIK